MAVNDSAAGGVDMAARLRSVRVGTREDLDVSRHLFRGEPSYIVRDPITFQSHRLEPQDYAIFCAISPDRPLGEVFDEFCRSVVLTRADEGAFYRFILTLHGLGFLRLPIADDAALYRRHEMKRRAKLWRNLTGFLFLRVPLWNPDAFLNRTVGYARPLFSRAFFLFWVVLILTAGWVAFASRHRLYEPLEGLLAAENLAPLWLTLIVLKVFHEFGHAYACKHFGGHVPEMGAYLILFTPCAYVDATGCWSFSRKRDRIIVCLAGMYVESLFAAGAVLVWAMTEPSAIHSLAYNVMFLASTVTVLFNINPLMRYDGYYVLSDLTEVPNLREKSERYLLNVARRIFLGIPMEQVPEGIRLRALLLGFGIAATVYRVTLVLAIAAVLSAKWLFAGAVVAAWFLGGMFVGVVRKLTHYLLAAEETAPVRRRAAALAVMTIVGIPAAVSLVPVPSRVHAGGVLRREHEDVVRARSPGFVENVTVSEGASVLGGEELVSLRNEEMAAAMVEADARFAAAELKMDVFRVTSPVRSLQEQAQALAAQTARKVARRRNEELSVVAPREGAVVQCVRRESEGVYLEAGAAVATIVSGAWQVRALLTADELARGGVRPGTRAEFRPATRAGRVLVGEVRSVRPAGSSAVELPALTQAGGGTIALEAASMQAGENLFDVAIDLPSPAEVELHFGSTGTVRLAGLKEPLGTSVIRRVHRFLNRIAEQ